MFKQSTKVKVRKYIHTFHAHCYIGSSFFVCAQKTRVPWKYILIRLEIKTVNHQKSNHAFKNQWHEGKNIDYKGKSKSKMYLQI